MEGLKLARVARSTRHRKRMPIVLVAPTEPGDDVRAIAKKAGGTQWVMKTQEVGEELLDVMNI